MLEKSPKSETGTRDLFVVGGLLELLKKEHAQNKGEYVVSRADGSPYAPDSFSRKFKRFLKQHELPYIKLHATRHSCASLMLSNGVDISTVQKTLGHASPTTTLNVYTHSTVAGSRAAAEKVDKLLLNPPSTSKSFFVVQLYRAYLFGGRSGVFMPGSSKNTPKIHQ